MTRQEVGQEESEIEDKLLTRIACVGISLGDVGARRDHAVDRGHHHREEDDKFGVIFGTNVERGNLGEALQSDVAEIRGFKKLRTGDRLLAGQKVAGAHTRCNRRSIIVVSKMYPSGIQFKNLRRVSKVAFINDDFWASSKTSEQSLKISENSPHI